MKRDAPLLVYDGDCGFCTASVRQMQRRLGRHPDAVAYQFADLDELGLTEAQCGTAVQWVGPDGEVRSAERAVAKSLIDAGKGWWLLGHLIDLPGIRRLSGVVYRWIARNRGHLPGATDSCRIP